MSQVKIRCCCFVDRRTCDYSTTRLREVPSRSLQRREWSNASRSVQQVPDWNLRNIRQRWSHGRFPVHGMPVGTARKNRRSGVGGGRLLKLYRWGELSRSDRYKCLRTVYTCVNAAKLPCVGRCDADGGGGTQLQPYSCCVVGVLALFTSHNDSSTNADKRGFSLPLPLNT